jgi:hypothetical protein
MGDVARGTTKDRTIRANQGVRTNGAISRQGSRNATETDGTRLA